MWNTKSFDELTVREWFEISKLRVDTFVVEQNCAYPEIDDHDIDAVHIFKVTDQLEAYARIIDKGDIYIGRVIVHPDYRGTGLGRKLMLKCLSHIEEYFPGKPVKLQGQAHLSAFYRSFGFEEKSVIYFDDMIPHVDMELINEDNI
ncbi:GNAT family N-acetyltransferase [Macrococcus carouselicus]|uniref:GNAT family N-acetyltransferase n=1 Tax=Macrococcus carouselicus TaxID=69969 RepID=A0A9Q8CGZ2_9STAP|nr:GNAT family N-acetyltransferase [Macrococcus carouselicus]TDL96599.1 GNAT family N-acetyltransferase [Macrococcus carouselicus]